LVVLGFQVEESRACTCPAPLPVEQALEEANAVFLGTVRSIVFDSLANNLVVILRAEQVWKGALQDSVQVRTAPHEGACGYTFRIAQSYLVYGFGDPLFTTLCTRTKDQREAAEEIERLNAVATADEDPELPRRSLLLENAPNPFYTATDIIYELPSEGPVLLELYDSRGQWIQTLRQGYQHAGQHRIALEAGSLPSGMYMAVLRTSEAVVTRNLLLVKK
jgi:hypothetical protein